MTKERGDDGYPEKPNSQRSTPIIIIPNAASAEHLLGIEANPPVESIGSPNVWPNAAGNAPAPQMSTNVWPE